MYAPVYVSVERKGRNSVGGGGSEKENELLREIREKERRSYRIE